MNRRPERMALDILFPISCLGCGRPEEWLCAECLSRISPLETRFCPDCERNPTPKGELCGRCRAKAERLPFEAAVFSAEYESVSRFVHMLKYRFVSDLADPLGYLMAKAFASSGSPLPEIIVPVPIHRSKLRARGFNQSALLASRIASLLAPGLDIPVIDNAAVRIRRTPPQMRIGRSEERLENVRGAFALGDKSRSLIKGRRLLLVDDIVTTGATVSACAEALQTAEPKEIRILALARQRTR